MLEFENIDGVVAHFRQFVDSFMKGGDYFMGDRWRDDRGNAHIWISRHDGFETLIIEPNGPSGGDQYEVAVRFSGGKSEFLNSDSMPGYICSTQRLISVGVDH